MLPKSSARPPRQAEQDTGIVRPAPRGHAVEPVVGTLDQLALGLKSVLDVEGVHVCDLVARRHAIDPAGAELAAAEREAIQVAVAGLQQPARRMPRDVDRLQRTV